MDEATVQLQVLEEKFQSQLRNMEEGSDKAINVEFLRADVKRAQKIVELLADRIVVLKDGRPPSTAR